MEEKKISFNNNLQCYVESKHWNSKVLPKKHMRIEKKRGRFYAIFWDDTEINLGRPQNHVGERWCEAEAKEVFYNKIK